jgi:hypothetical protein
MCQIYERISYPVLCQGHQEESGNHGHDRLYGHHSHHSAYHGLPGNFGDYGHYYFSFRVGLGSFDKKAKLKQVSDLQHCLLLFIYRM